MAARAALNSLKALNPMALARWNSGVSIDATPPATPRTPHHGSGASSQPNLPSVNVRPPSEPSRGGRRPPSVGRKSSTPRQTESQPSLPCAAPSARPESAQTSEASIKTAYKMTPREQAERQDSPVQRPRRSTQTTEVSRSAPAAPSLCQDAPSRKDQLGATGNMREIVEVQSHAQRLLEAVFEITITEEASVSILESYPELVWLANCLRRCPLPPGWTAVDDGNGRLHYVDMESNVSSDISPLLHRVVDMGRLMLHWRQNPNTCGDIAVTLKTMQLKDEEESKRARRIWQGPYKDPSTGSEFWHCPITGRSTWGNPGAASEFLSRIADRLHQALPTSPSQPASGVSSQSDAASELPEVQRRKAQRPQTPHHSGVPAVVSPRPPSSQSSRPRPQVGNPAGVIQVPQASEPSGPTLTDVAEDICQQMSARGKDRAAAMAAERDYPRSDELLDTNLRPECRRRRPTSLGPSLTPLSDESHPSNSVDPKESLQLAGPAAAATELAGTRPMTSQGQRPPKAAGLAQDDVGRPRTRRSHTDTEEADESKGEAAPAMQTGMKMLRQGSSRLNFTGTAGLGASAMVGNMCAGAIAAALKEANSPSSQIMDDEEDLEDDMEMQAAIAAANQRQIDCDEAPTSPSMMSILVPQSPTPKKLPKVPLSPQAESPSLIVMDNDESPQWTAHKPLPKAVAAHDRPRTPPRMKPLRFPLQSDKSERPVVLGIPEPLSARARCSKHEEQPLSARRPRPGKARVAVGGA